MELKKDKSLIINSSITTFKLKGHMIMYSVGSINFKLVCNGCFVLPFFFGVSIVFKYF